MEIILTLGLLAIIPAMIASKKGREAGPWWIYGVLLLPIAVVHALLIDDGSRHPCPHCAEPIQSAALICPHCRSDLPPADQRQRRPRQKQITWHEVQTLFFTLWVAGVIVLAVHVVSKLG